MRLTYPVVKSIADWMTERGIDVAQLIEASALDPKVVEAVVHGHYTPSPQQRQRLAAALGLASDQVLWGHVAQVEHIHGHGPQFGRSP